MKYLTLMHIYNEYTLTRVHNFIQKFMNVFFNVIWQKCDTEEQNLNQHRKLL